MGGGIGLSQIPAHVPSTRATHLTVMLYNCMHN